MSAWLFTILRNLFRSEYRKRRREVEDTDGTYAESLKSHPEQHSRVEFDEFRAALGKWTFLQAFRAALGESPFSQAISAAFSQLSFLDTVGAAFGNVVGGGAGTGWRSSRFGRLSVRRDATESRKEGNA